MLLSHKVKYIGFESRDFISPLSDDGRKNDRKNISQRKTQIDDQMKINHFYST
jgi:hypothetical protein